MTLFDGICRTCRGQGEHFDWCPVPVLSAESPTLAELVAAMEAQPVPARGERS